MKGYRKLSKKGIDIMKHKFLFIVIAIILLSGILIINGEENSKLNDFLFPFQKNSARLTYILNGDIDNNAIKEKLTLLTETGMWSGYAFIPQISTTPESSSTEYDSLFRTMLNLTHVLENKVSLYEDFSYIDAKTKKLLEEQYTDIKAEYLFLVEKTLKDGETETFEIPDGILMSAVGMNLNTKSLNDLSGFISEDGKVTVVAPRDSGDWKIMFFMCRTLDSKDTSINFLSRDASLKYINFSYSKYPRLYPEYNSNTFDSAYFANISMKNVDGEIVWTSDFNEKFEAKYKVSPAVLYPALFYDIGDPTTYAKVSLYSFRAELLSEGFPKAMKDFASLHSLLSIGNTTAFQSIIPTGYSGDYIKFYKYVDIPVFQELSSQGTSSKMIKLVTSASYNYNKKITAASLFKPYEIINEEVMYKSIMEAYTNGINSLYINSAYYNKDVTVNNNLSHISDLAPIMPAINTYISRLNTFLQEGDTVIDIAVIYPIETLHAAYNSNKISREDIPYLDYLDVGDWLHRNIKTDFMFLHPDIIAQSGFEKYSAVVLPGCEVISVKTLEKLKEYYDNGGKIISTYRLPSKSAEKDMDDKVQEIIQYIFGQDAYNSKVEGRVYKNQGKTGGSAFFIHSYAYGSHEYYKNPSLMEIAIDESIRTRDISFKGANTYGEGYISYIHKTSEESDVFFIANTGNEKYTGTVTLKGTFRPVILNPHTGEITVPEYKQYKLNGNKVTNVKIEISSLRSIIIYCGEIFEDTSVPLIYKGDPALLDTVLDNGTFSFTFSLHENGKIQFALREDEEGNGYYLEIEEGRLNVYKSSEDDKEILESFVVSIENDLYYLFTFTMEKDLLTAYLSGNRIFEIYDQSYKEGTLRLTNLGMAEIGDITVLGEVKKVSTAQVSYTFYIIVLMTLVVLKFAKRR